MKRTFNVLGIIAIVAIIGFSVLACSDDSGGNNGGNTGGNTNNKTLSGTYSWQYLSVTFSGGNFTYYGLGMELAGGTYTINGNIGKATFTWVNTAPGFTFYARVGDVEYVTIIDDNSFRDSDGNIWTKR
jgi:hypothetical protein